MNHIYNETELHVGRITTLTDILGVIILSVAFLIGLFLFLNFSPLFWVDLITDDAYYYLGIARNIVERGVSSFLPPFETNGYQPLWLILLTGFSAIVGTTINSLVIQLYLLTFLFGFIFIYLSKKYYGLGYPAAIITLSFSHIVLNGMETVMIPPFFILFVSSSSWLKRGFIGSILFLSRLDAISIVVARDLYLYFNKREIDFRHYFLIIPVALIYISINYYIFGVPLPVSGLAKSVGNIFAENSQTGFGYIKSLKTAAVLFVLIFLVLKLNKKNIIYLKFFDEIIILSIVCCFCIAYYAMNSGWPIWYWYYWAPFILSYYLLVEAVYLINYFLISKKSSLVSVCATVLLIGVAYAAKPAIPYIFNRVKLLVDSLDHKPLVASFGRKNIDLVAWIQNNNIPKNTMFAMGDRAGSFGFFLGNDFRFFHTEGLVGPIAYYKAMLADKAINFVDNLNIDYWIADRENFIESNDILGLIEPIQGLSSHQGPYVVCFRKEGIILDQSYLNPHNRSKQQLERRYVISSRYRINCPNEIQDSFNQMRNHYAGVRKFSLPFEYEK